MLRCRPSRYPDGARRERFLAVGILLFGLAAMTMPAVPDANAPLIIGHRGAPGHLPDHTLESYRRAVELGADYIEPDLVATKDGILIARHDVDLGATTNVADHPEFAGRKTVKIVDGVRIEDWFADDFTLAEIRTLRARQPLAFRPQAFDGRYQIPTFEEIVRLVLDETRRLGRPIGIYPETKHPSYHAQAGLELEPALLAILGRYGLDRRDAPIMIQSFEVSNLKALRVKTPVRLIQLIDADAVTRNGTPQPNRPYDFTLRGDVRTYADLISRPGLREIAAYADGIGPWKRYLTDCASARSEDETRTGSASGTPCLSVADAHQAGLLVHPWTFRDEPRYLAARYQGDPVHEYLDYFRLGVDGVFSDFPDTAARAREQWRR
jgi:glycerophosphoryl diester phosphodiesterase